MFLFALNKDKVFRGFLTCPLEGYRSATEIKGLLNAQGRESMESQVQTEKYAKCVEGSKRIRWDIDKDVFRGREFDFSKKFLPDGISKLDQLKFIADDERKTLSQIQGRTYANMFGFVERFIVAKILEISRNHWLGDQIALEALVRFCDEELKHQELFRRIEVMMASSLDTSFGSPGAMPGPGGR